MDLEIRPTFIQQVPNPFHIDFYISDLRLIRFSIPTPNENSVGIDTRLISLNMSSMIRGMTTSCWEGSTGPDPPLRVYGFQERGSPKAIIVQM